MLRDNKKENHADRFLMETVFCVKYLLYLKHNPCQLRYIMKRDPIHVNIIK